MRHDRLAACIAALAGAFWCSLYVWPLINPFSLEVVFRDDWAQHTLGWLFYRNQHVLDFPLGRLRDFLYPLGSTLGYMDSIPWVALSLRPFSALLPTDFQYLGLWIVLCSASLAYVGARIASAATPHPEQQALIGVLTAMAPSLIARIVHPALCAHVLIVAALGINLVPNEPPTVVRRSLITAFALLCVGSATHPYFAVMVLAIVIGLPVRLRPRIGRRTMILVMTSMLIAAGTILTLLGYVGGGMQDALDGFGVYSANLNTFVNSMGHSRLFRGLPTTIKQYEGYSYLGGGVFFLAIVALGTLIWPAGRRRVCAMPWRRALWPVIAALLCAVFAVASPIRWGEHELFAIAAYKPFDQITQSFRSSGRFIWPLAYVIVLSISLSVACALRQRRLWSTLIFASAVIIQAYDLDMGEALQRFHGARDRVMSATEWSLADGAYRHLVLYPAEIMNACEGRKHYRGRYVTELAYLAYRHHWTFNSGYAARLRPTTQQYCQELKNTVGQGQLQPDELYVVHSRDVHHMRDVGATCGRLDQEFVCVTPSDRPLATFLAAHPK
jgi:hypothetical protein